MEIHSDIANHIMFIGVHWWLSNMELGSAVDYQKSCFMGTLILWRHRLGGVLGGSSWWMEGAVGRSKGPKGLRTSLRSSVLTSRASSFQLVFIMWNVWLMPLVTSRSIAGCQNLPLVKLPGLGAWLRFLSCDRHVFFRNHVAGWVV